MPLPSNVSYGTVVGTFLTATADSPDDVDRDPQGVAATDLKFRFSPDLSTPVARDATATPPVMFALQDINATVGTDGSLLGPDNAPGVKLVASTNSALQPNGWTWKVTLSGAGFPAMSWSFLLDPGATIDLATVLPIPANPGATLNAWLQAVADATAARDAAQAAAASVPSAASLAATYLTYDGTNILKNGVTVPVSGGGGGVSVGTGKNALTGQWHAAGYGDTSTMASAATAINAAITAASTAGGGTVRLDGAITVSAPIVPKSGVTLYGADPAATTLRWNPATSGSIISATTTSFTGFHVDGVGFLGSVTETPTAPKRGRAGNTTGTVSAVFLDGDLDTAATGTPGTITDFTMTRSSVRNCAALPIIIKGVRGTVRVENNFFDNNQDIGFTFCEEVIFTGNHVMRSADNGVSLSRGCKKVVCVGNTFDNCAYNGIWASGFSSDLGPTDFTIGGNVVRNVGHAGINIDGAPAYGVIAGNSLYGGYYRGPSDEANDVRCVGIYLGGYPGDRTALTAFATGIHVSDNVIRAFPRAGIYTAGVKNCTITGNDIHDVGTQYMADGTTAIASTDTNNHVGILIGYDTTSANITVSLNTVTDGRATPYTNYAVTPTNSANVAAYLNNQSGLRNAFNLVESGPQRTHYEINLWQAQQRFVAGAIAGSNAATGSVAGFKANGAAGSTRSFTLQTAGADRWLIGTDTAAESGSNAGSGFAIQSRDDTAAALSTVFSATRAGAVTLGVAGQPVTLAGTPAVPTAAPGTSTTQAASTAFVGSAVNGTGTPSNPVSSASATRPTGLTVVYWKTATQPTNWVAGDVWTVA